MPGSALADAALSHADRRFDADRSGTGEQRRSRRASGARRRAWAERSRCIPTVRTRRSRCRPRRARRRRCARSRSSGTNRALPMSSIRSPARITSRALTDELVARAKRIIEEVDAMGGSIAAIESGWMQARIAESAYLAQQAIERGEQVVVGVNRFAEAAATSEIPLQRIDDRIEHEQVERLRRVSRRPRRGRCRPRVSRRFAALRRAARTLMPHFVDAVDAGVTLGEICNVLREVFGTYRCRNGRVNGTQPMEIDHVAIVVKDLEAAVRFYTRTLGFKEVLSRSRLRPGRRDGRIGSGRVLRRIAFYRSTKTRRSLATAERPQTKLHHTAYRVADIEGKLAELKAAGVALIDERPPPGRARQPHRISPPKGDRRRSHRTLPASSAPQDIPKEI